MEIPKKVVSVLMFLIYFCNVSVEVFLRDNAAGVESICWVESNYCQVSEHGCAYLNITDLKILLKNLPVLWIWWSYLHVSFYSYMYPYLVECFNAFSADFFLNARLIFHTWIFCSYVIIYWWRRYLIIYIMFEALIMLKYIWKTASQTGHVSFSQ